jgi:hypothetical protein
MNLNSKLIKHAGIKLEKKLKKKLNNYANPKWSQSFTNPLSSFFFFNIIQKNP